MFISLVYYNHILLTVRITYTMFYKFFPITLNLFLNLAYYIKKILFTNGKGNIFLTAQSGEQHRLIFFKQELHLDVCSLNLRGIMYCHGVQIKSFNGHNGFHWRNDILIQP